MERLFIQLLDWFCAPESHFTFWMQYRRSDNVNVFMLLSPHRTILAKHDRTHYTEEFHSGSRKSRMLSTYQPWHPGNAFSLTAFLWSDHINAGSSVIKERRLNWQIRFCSHREKRGEHSTSLDQRLNQAATSRSLFRETNTKWLKL